MKAHMCWRTAIFMMAFILGIIVTTQAVKEGFASSQGGAQIQLATSHVPRPGELEEEAEEEAVMIDYGLRQMTESGLYL
jgi:hypothetical protein